jgi:cell division protein FtsZ
VLFNVCGGESLTLFEVNEAAEIIGKAVDPEANIIFGVVFDPKMDNEVRMTLIATGFTSKKTSKVRKDEELRQFIHNMENELELDVPTFLRHPQAKRRAMEAPATGQYNPRSRSGIH